MRTTVCLAALWLTALFFTTLPSDAISMETRVEISPQTIHQGDAVLVKVLPATPFSEVNGKWGERSILFSRDPGKNGFEAIMGMDLTHPPGKETLLLTFADRGGAVHQKRVVFHVHERRFKVQHLTLPRKMVTLSPEDLARFKREKAAVQALFASPTDERLWRGGFILPVQGKLLSPFGATRVINEEPRSPHSGIDLRAALGTPVRASSEGRVALVGDHFFAGKSVYLDHGAGIFSMYFHLSEILVREGAFIACGQIIGKAGKSGRATGPHLHWGVRIQGSRVDPLTLVHLFE